MKSSLPKMFYFMAFLLLIAVDGSGPMMGSSSKGKKSSAPSSFPSPLPSAMPSMEACLCPGGFSELRYEDSDQTWSTHVEMAAAEGCTLASITSDEERAAALDLIVDTTTPTFFWVAVGGVKPFGTIAGAPDILWIDGTDSNYLAGGYATASTEPNNAFAREPYIGLAFRDFAAGNNNIATGDFVDYSGQLSGAIYRCCPEGADSTLGVCPLPPPSS